MWAVWFIFACAGNTDTDADVAAEPTPPERVVLHEAFSGSNCGPCAPAADNMANALAEHSGDYTLLKYQIGSDPYISQEAVSRRMFYLPDQSSYEIPYVHADGVGFHPNDIDGDGTEIPYSTEDFLNFLEAPTVLGIAVEAQLDGQTVDIQLTLEPWEGISRDNLRLMIAIAEKTTFQNTGSNGQTEFHHVLKKFVPDQNGTVLDALVAGESTTHDVSHTFVGDYQEETGIRNMVDHSTGHTVEEFDDLEVVVWVQDFDNWEVFNSAWTDVE